jgi:hypothetical protein
MLERDPKKPGPLVLTFDNPCDRKRIGGMIVAASCASQFDNRRDHRPVSPRVWYIRRSFSKRMPRSCHIGEPDIRVDFLGGAHRRGAFARQRFSNCQLAKLN